MSDLVLVAASGLAREVVEAVRAAGTDTVVAILDDDPRRRGEQVLGVPVVGGIDEVDALHPDTRLVLCAGKGSARAAIAARLADRGVTHDRFATVLHPSVHVPGSCVVGAGSVLLTGVVLTADVTVGRHVVAMPHVVLTHDDVVEDFVTLAAGVRLGGWVRVGARAYLGMGSGVRERTTVGQDAVVGMGAAVVGDVPDGQTWVGVPARPLPVGAGVGA